MYAWFDNSEKKSVSRAQHLVDLPDSLDVVSLLCPDNLSDWEIREMSEIQMEKGTKVIYDISFDSIKVCLLYTSPSPRDRTRSRMPSSA